MAAMMWFLRCKLPGENGHWEEWLGNAPNRKLAFTEAAIKAKARGIAAELGTEINPLSPDYFLIVDGEIDLKLYEQPSVQ
jgi:hypothetical protein